MKTSSRPRAAFLLLALGLLIACNLPTRTPSAPTNTAETAPSASLPSAAVTFRVHVPPTDAQIVLTLLDEVTGININPQRYPMEKTAEGFYQVQIQAPRGAMLKYRYERHDPDGAVAFENQITGSVVRYRMLRVDGDMLNEDLVARWNDTLYDGALGRIQGTVTDEQGTPLPDVLVTAGGAQTLTQADGSYLLENIPVGEHTLVAYALDGQHSPFQQRARVGAHATTPADLVMETAALVPVQFTVQVPNDTITGAPVRLAGNLYSLGNTFADLGGGMSTLASRMPVLTPAGEGRYTLTLQLPAGAYIRYKYTLGDGFWNAEHDAEGRFVTREFIVPAQGTTLTDVVATWHSGNNAPVWFETTVPANTFPGDVVDLQLNPAVWTPPLPMWPLGDNRWGYLLTSPTDLAGEIAYRFCRGEDCAATHETTAEKRVFQFTPASQKIKTETEWAWWQPGAGGGPAMPPQIQPRESAPWAGFALMPSYHPSWQPYTGRTMAEIRTASAQWVVLTPTWTAHWANPPVWEPHLGLDPLLTDITAMAEAAHANGLNTALFFQARFPEGQEAWWLAGNHDFAWWVSWFDRYTTFANHAARVAQNTQAGALILGGAWVQPAMPAATLPDGTPSGVPADAAQRWRDIIAHARERYHGPIYWALPLEALDNPPPFLDAVDGLYILWAPDLGEDQAQWPKTTASLLDEKVRPVAERFHKPIVLAVAYPSAQGARGGCVPADTGCLPQEALFPQTESARGVPVDLGVQQSAYAALLDAVNTRPWVSGIISADFYPPMSLHGPSASVHGKPANDLLAWWYAALLTPAP